MSWSQSPTDFGWQADYIHWLPRNTEDKIQTLNLITVCEAHMLTTRQTMRVTSVSWYFIDKNMPVVYLLAQIVDWI